MFSIDEVEYDNVMVSKLSRKFEIRDGNNAGTSINGKSIRDIIGTYISYEVTLDPSLMNASEYDSLYNIITSPVPYHTVKFPYGQTEYEFEAEITSGSDDLILLEPNYNLWDGLKITFSAISPNRIP